MDKKLKITWKAIVAIVLVFSMLIAMSAVVSAGFVELLLGEDGVAIMAATGTTASCSPHEWRTVASGEICSGCNQPKASQSQECSKCGATASAGNLGTTGCGCP